MTDLWLAFALLGTFLTVALVGVVVDMVIRDRGRPLALLQSQVGQGSEPVDLRDEDLTRSSFDRLVLPAAKRVGRAVVRITPFDLVARVDELLVLAGNPAGWEAERVVALKIVGGVGGAVGGGFVTALGSLPPAIGLLLVITLGGIGYLVPSVRLRAMADRRQKGIRGQLSDVIDLLAISVEAGLGLDAAIGQVTRNVPGPLAEEMERLAHEIQIGVSRGEAFRHLGERTNVRELQGFVLSMIQAEQFGVSIANVLRAQSRELRTKRRQLAEETAQKIPVKLLFPLIFLVLPATFIIILGPGVIKIIDQFT